MGYVVNLESDNFENKLHHKVVVTGLNNSSCLSSCLHTDANNVGEHLTTKLISVLANHKDSGTPIDSILEVLLLIYQKKGYIKLLNNWDNPDFYMTTFPTIFSFEIGGHLVKKDESKQIQVSL